MNLIDPTHPFYKPLWRRIAVVAACGAWFAVEIIWWISPFFIPITGALFAYTAWVLLLKWKNEKA